MKCSSKSQALEVQTLYPSFELHRGLVAHIAEMHKEQKIEANVKCKVCHNVLASPRTLTMHEEKMSVWSNPSMSILQL